MALAALAPAVFFGALEAGLRWAGYGYDPAFLVPDPQDPDQLIDNDRFGWRFFPRALSRTSQPLRVARQKPADTVRIVVFGGSAAMGDPEPAWGLARQLEVLLGARFPDRKFEVINAAMTAINSHVVLPLARDCRVLEADYWVVYLGNNEVNGPFGRGSVFGAQAPPLWIVRANLGLRRTRTGQLLSGLMDRGDAGVPKSWGGMEMFLRQRVAAGDPQLERVYGSLRRNLEDIVRAGHRSGSRVLVGTVAVNLRDSAPFASEEPSALAEPERAAWRSAFDAGSRAQAEGRFEAAAEELLRAASLFAGHAESRHRLAVCLAAAGKPGEAAPHFAAARDLDLLRFRADSRINAVIRQAGGEAGSGARLVDVETQFREASADGVPGDEWFYEHVHFRLAGNHLLARAFAEVIAGQLGGSDSAAGAGFSWPDAATCARELGWTPLQAGEVAGHMAERRAAPPFTAQWDAGDRLAALREEMARERDALNAAALSEARSNFQRLLAARPEDAGLLTHYAAFLASAGDPDAAEAQERRFTGLYPHRPEGWFRLGAFLNRRQLWSDAEAALRRAVALRPGYPQAWNSLGICLARQRRFAEASAAFSASTAADPRYAEAHDNWALVLAQEGREEAARQRLEEAVRARPDYLPAWQHLAEMHVKGRRDAEAEAAYREVARLAPRDPGARINLGLILLKRGDREGAREQLGEARRLDPGNAVAGRYLESLESGGSAP